MADTFINHLKEDERQRSLELSALRRLIRAYEPNNKPIAAPIRFPYPHRTLAEVWASEEGDEK